jgi:sugar phosphate isomerase/epimerase
MLKLGAALRINELPAQLEWLWQHGGRDVELQDPCYAGFLEGDWRTSARAALELLTSYGGRIGVHGAYDGLENASFDPVVQRFVTARHLTSLEFAESVGATQVVVHSPFTYFGRPNANHTLETGLARQLEYVHATFAPVVSRAAEIGCELVFENIYDRATFALLELVRSFGSSHVRLSLDVGHAHLMHLLGGPSIDTWLLEGAELLSHVHLQDNDGAADRHWACGDGQIDWLPVLDSLKRMATQSRLLLEVSPDDLARAAAHLTATGLAV